MAGLRSSSRRSTVHSSFYPTQVNREYGLSNWMSMSFSEPVSELSSLFPPFAGGYGKLPNPFVSLWHSQFNITSCAFGCQGQIFTIWREMQLHFWPPKMPRDDQLKPRAKPMPRASAGIASRRSQGPKGFFAFGRIWTMSLPPWLFSSSLSFVTCSKSVMFN
jgi:hypothetical protein